MNMQDKSTGPEKATFNKFMSKQRDMVCIDLSTLHMLLSDTETDAAEATQLIKEAIKKQGYEDVKDNLQR